MRQSNRYFHPRKFIHNNINFRIKTSEAMNLFKANQTFVLKQMTYNSKFEFSMVSKDIMLLKYDVWYDWLNEVEQLLLGSDISREDNKRDILELASERKKYYEDTLRENFAGDDLKFVNFWIEIHEKLCSLLKDKIKNISSLLKKEDFFFEITRITSNVMRRTLYELQELETIFFDSGEVNICIDNICIEISKKDVNFFKDKINKYQNIKKFKRVVIKNYSDIDDLEIIYENALDYLKEQNISYYII